MLLISELVRFTGLLAADRLCPAAEAPAARWGAAGVVSLRSSASHVLVARRSDASRVVLRMRPDHGEAAVVLGRGARVARDWRAAGGPLAGPVPSLGGLLVELVDGYAVTALEAVRGDPLDDDATDPAVAYAWGATLARAHSAGKAVDRADLPTTESFLAGRDVDVPAGLRRVAADLLAALGRLPRDPAVHGLLHGDPEPDNVVDGPDGQLLVDPDDVRVGWFV
jgi:Ser/Thr protein kinase RdoA (MazF antagonist)